MKHLFDDKKYLCWGLTSFFVIIGSILFYMLLQHWTGIKAAVGNILSVLSPVIWGFVIAYVLRPVVRFLQKKLFGPLTERLCRKKPERAPKLARGLSAALALIILILLLSGLMWTLLPQIYESVETLVVNIPEYARTVVSWAENLLKGSPELETTAVSFLENISASITDWFNNSILPRIEVVITNVTTGVYRVVKGIANLLVGFIISIYLMYNRERFLAWLKKLIYGIFSPKNSKRVLNCLRFADSTFMSFISGQLIDALIVGVVCYFGCLIMGMPYAVLVSVIVAVTNIIPFFGPFIGAVPSAFLILMSGSPLKCLMFVIFIVVLQQLDGNVLSPRILGSKVGINGFWVMFAILLFGGLFGFAGMLLGVPVMTIALAGVQTLVDAALKRRGLPTESEHYENLDYIDPETKEEVRLPSENESAAAENNGDGEEAGESSSK